MPAVLGIASQHSANADMHSHTTAPEILAAFKGKELDYWVSGFGTDGTLKGVVRVLKAARPNIHIIATEPETRRYWPVALLSSTPTRELRRPAIRVSARI
jgi:cysteine synthase